MTVLKTKIGRRSFLKTSAAAGGGLMISFSWLASCTPSMTKEEVLAMPKEWFELNAYLKIGENGAVTIRVPNPEFGQNIKTSMPMIVAEELDTNWKFVTVEQAPFDQPRFGRQFTGGSQGIRTKWNVLRMAGATARQMLREAAANEWKVPVEQISTAAGSLIHEASGNQASYGDFASAAAQSIAPEEVTLKEVNDFTIIGSSKKNIDGKDIVSGSPMFTLDIKTEGMLYAAIIHPPAFGQQLTSYDASDAKKMPGIIDVFTFKTMDDDYVRNYFDTNTHNELIAIVGNSTWEVFNAKKAVRTEWENFKNHSFTMDTFGRKSDVSVPEGLESTDQHLIKMSRSLNSQGRIVRKDGNPEKAFSEASKIIERTYSAPFLAHNMMEPIVCYANVTKEKAEIRGPIQTPELIEGTIAERLGMTREQIEIEMVRMGGGFGRRAYGHYMVEAAIISQRIGRPVKLTYTREDDMSYGIYRPAYAARYKAGLDENNNLIAFYVNAGGIPESPLHANRFPAGAVDNYQAEDWYHESNITIGAFRAPASNFIAGAEQSFLDEVAEAAGKDPIQFRLELLEKAKANPVGEDNDYDADRYAGVLRLVKEKSNWDSPRSNVSRGIAAYFCHNSYAAHVLDLKIENGRPRVDRVTCAIDCGIVVNPDAAANMAEGAIVDGIGNAFYGAMTFSDGKPDKDNFHNYRMIRSNEAPRNIAVHFVQNEIDPTGLGEPPFPPIFAAVANALYKATERRHYHQPFFGDALSLG